MKVKRVLFVPITDALVASIPFPMDDFSFDLLMETLQLWKKRLVQEDDDLAGRDGDGI